MQPMKIRYSDYFAVEPSNGAAIVRFEVRTVLDTAAVQDVASDLYALVDQHGMTDLVLDLAGVRFLSSQALGALVNLQRKVRAAGGRLVLAAVCGNIAHMFRITRLDGLFTFQEQPSSALQPPEAPGCCRMAGAPRESCRDLLGDDPVAIILTNGPRVGCLSGRSGPEHS